MKKRFSKIEGIVVRYAVLLDCGHVYKTSNWKEDDSDIGAELECFQCEGLKQKPWRVKAIPEFRPRQPEPGATLAAIT